MEHVKGTGYFSRCGAPGGMITAAHAENSARAAGWFCSSCDQPREWSRDHIPQSAGLPSLLSILALAKAQAASTHGLRSSQPLKPDCSVCGFTAFNNRVKECLSIPERSFYEL
jgi:hypothetical protein